MIASSTQVTITPNKVITTIPARRKTFLESKEGELLFRARGLNNSSVLDLRHLIDTISNNVQLQDAIRENAKRIGHSYAIGYFYIQEKLLLTVTDNIQRPRYHVWNPKPYQEESEIMLSALVAKVLKDAQEATNRARQKETRINEVTENDVVKALLALIQEFDKDEKGFIDKLTQGLDSPYSETETKKELQLVRDLLLPPKVIN